jgi:DHA1 family bicyclomycin/chloramphenicol resistance-like MFS transporter
MVRDGQSGPAMARVMSLVMSVFIIVPVLAPALGQLVLLVAGWRDIFVLFLLIAVSAGAWLAWRQPETLAPERRRPVSVGALARAARQVLSHRVTMAYTLTAGLSSGLLIAYLGVCQQVFSDLYDQGQLFVLYFGVLAAALGLASVINARIVMRLGMRRLTGLALRATVILSLVFLAVCMSGDGVPPLAAFMAYMFPIFFCLGMLFGNCNALAMEPMGPIAGMAASIIGSISSVVSVLAGGLVSQLYDGTLRPLVIGYAVISVMALLTSMLAGKDYH